MLIIPSKSRDVADENNKILTEMEIIRNNRISLFHLLGWMHLIYFNYYFYIISHVNYNCCCFPLK
jgi:hypothetical protein